MVDSSDQQRITEAKEELMKVLAHEELRDATVLIYANKQDLPNAMKVSEVTDKLGMHSMTKRKWYVQSCCGTTGEGIYEGLEWLSRVVV